MFFWPYDLLTNLACSRLLDIDFVSVQIKMQKKNLANIQQVLTSRLVNNAYVFNVKRTCTNTVFCALWTELIEPRAGGAPQCQYLLIFSFIFVVCRDRYVSFCRRSKRVCTKRNSSNFAFVTTRCPKTCNRCK